MRPALVELQLGLPQFDAKHGRVRLLVGGVEVELNSAPAGCAATMPGQQSRRCSAASRPL